MLMCFVWQELSNSWPGWTRLCRRVAGNRRKNFLAGPIQAQMSLLHSAAALIDSALALAETFVLLAVVLGVFWLAARAIFRMFRKD
jgi:hypothetical protein